MLENDQKFVFTHEGIIGEPKDTGTFKNHKFKTKLPTVYGQRRESPSKAK